jgi:hypothetical protein
VVFCKQAVPGPRKNKCSNIYNTKKSPQYPLNTVDNDKYIEEGVNTKFLGLKIVNHLNWRSRIDQLIPKLSGTCFAVRFISHISNIDTLISVYFAYFWS